MKYVSYWLLAISLLLAMPTEAAKRKVHTIGDSTMSEYKPAATQKRGWGMYLQAFFNPDSVEVNNRGKSGASTRTFYETEALWPSVKAQMSAGDYLIIQFAHNDEKCKGEDVYVKNADLRANGQDTLTDMRGTEPNTTYKAYLRKYIHEAWEMGVTPILMAPICRAYFKEGKITGEGKHDLTVNTKKPSEVSKNYVQAMREVAEDLGVPFLDMTARTQEFYEQCGQDYCMTHYFNCGDKTHTSAEGGMAIASLAYELISQSPELEAMHTWQVFPSKEEYTLYAQAIEERGKKAAFTADGTPFMQDLKVANLRNLRKKHFGYLPLNKAWPAGEIDEVANRYVEYTISADKKKGMVIESIVVPICAVGGKGMNIHVNAGLGEAFRDVTTLYENTAIPKGKAMLIHIDQPILVPAGDTLHIRVLPWYDSHGRPQKGKRLELGDLRIKGKRLK